MRSLQLFSPRSSREVSRETSPQRQQHGPIARLSSDMLTYIFLFLFAQEGSFRSLPTLSLVCQRWCTICQGNTLWRQLTKRYFISYPLIQRLTHAVPLKHEDEAVYARVSGHFALPRSRRDKSTAAAATTTAAPPPSSACVSGSNGSATRAGASSLPKTGSSRTVAEMDKAMTASLPGATIQAANELAKKYTLTQEDDIEAPTHLVIRRVTLEMRAYFASKRYHVLVQRRRVFVIHSFVALALLCLSMFLLTAMCAAEGYDPITVCNKEVPFHFLWLTYMATFGAVVSNIVMETHFEPQPLIQRLRLHTHLIQVSTAGLTLFLLFIGLPTYFVQWNVRQKELHWALCFSPIIVALLGWQVEVIFAVRHQAWRSLGDLYNIFAYTTPLLFCGAVLCVAQYLEEGGWWYLLVGTMPLGLALFSLTVVFLMDYSVKHESNDLLAATCLAVANLLPICVAVTGEFRGLTLLPVIVASFGFFGWHFDGLRLKFQEAMMDPDAALFDADDAWN